MIGGGGGVKVRLGVQVGNGVGEFNEAAVGSEGVNFCKVGEEVGIKVEVGVGVGAEVEVEFEEAILLPSANESEKPPRSKPTEASAMMIPRNTCRKLFTASSFRATLPRPAAGH